MNRRDFVASLGGVAVGWAGVAQAQSRPPLVLAWFGGSANDPEIRTREQTVREALQALGWIDGRNLRLEYRTSLNIEQSRAVAAEVAALALNVIVASTAPVLAAAHRLTKTIPIVFMQVTDPVSDGFVASLARPGGNVTGFTISNIPLRASGWRCSRTWCHP
jgi:putative ABC transport system substrate-binding protein